MLKISTKKHELNDKMSSFINIFLTSNIIQIRFNDSAHSKYENVTKNLHIFLINAILIVQKQKNISENFETFLFLLIEHDYNFRCII